MVRVGIRGVRGRGCKRPGKVVWVGRVRRVERREEGRDGVGVGGESWERARRVACRATLVFCWVWRGGVGVSSDVGVCEGLLGVLSPGMLSVATSEGGRAVDVRSGQGRLRSDSLGVGAPILEARAWNVFRTSGGLEVS